jgi:pimeloyl-ACP methyl ester carboxylesterase
MIHGFLENLAVWHLGLAPVLRDEFRIMTYDLRGHGRSDLTPNGYTPAGLAADLEALMDALNVGRATLVGRSFGADVALRFCARCPDRVAQLVAIEPALVGGLAHRGDEAWGGWSYWGGQLERVGVTLPPEKRTDLQFLLEQTVRTPAFDGPFGLGPRHRDQLLRLIGDTALLTECGEVLDMTRDLVRGIRTPTLLVYGARSPFLASFDFLRASLPRCRTLIVPDAGHLKPWERTRMLGDEIRRFLREGERASAPAIADRSTAGAMPVELPGR